MCGIVGFVDKKIADKKPVIDAQKSINWTIFLPEVKCFKAFSFFL